MSRRVCARMPQKPFAFVSSRLSPSYGRRIPFSKPQTVETHGEGKERRRKNNPGDFSSLSTSPFPVERRNESNYSSRVKREGSWIRINWKQDCRCSVNTLLDGVRYDSTLFPPSLLSMNLQKASTRSRRGSSPSCLCGRREWSV